MATRSAKPKDDTLAVESELADIDPQDIELERLKAQYPDDTLTLHIYRQGMHARDLELIDEIPIGLFKPMDLAYPPYNGGTFRLHARTDSGIAYNRLIKVQRKTQDAPAVKAGLDESGVARLIDDRLERILARLQPQQPPVDPLVMMSQLAGVLKTLMPAATAPVVPQQGASLLEQLTLFSKMQDLIKGMSGAGVAKDEDGATDVTGTLLTKGIDMIGNLVNAAQSQQRPALAAPQSETAQPAEISAQPVNNAEDAEEMRIMVKFALRAACAAAKAGEDAEDFADKWFNEIPEDVLIGLSTDPEWYKKLSEMYPECSQYETWFAALRDILVAWYAGDQKVDAPGSLDITAESAQAVSTNNDTLTPINGNSDVRAGPGATPDT